MNFLKRIFSSKHSDTNNEYKGLLEDSLPIKQKITSADLPAIWESLRAFSIVIPFHERHLHKLDGTIREAMRFRGALFHLCYTTYFQDEIYESIINIKKTQALRAELEDYFREATSRFESLVCEKIGLILLFEGIYQNLSPTQEDELFQTADKYPNCDAINFWGDPQVKDPRSAVVRYAYNGRLLIVEPGTCFSKTRMIKTLKRMLREQA